MSGYMRDLEKTEDKTSFIVFLSRVYHVLKREMCVSHFAPRGIYLRSIAVLRVPTFLSMHVLCLFIFSVINDFFKKSKHGRGVNR